MPNPEIIYELEYIKKLEGKIEKPKMLYKVWILLMVLYFLRLHKVFEML